MDDVIKGKEISERFGALLYRLREAQGLSQNAAARRVGVSQPRIRDYEQGRDPHTGKPTLPPPAVIRALAKLYHYPDELLLLMAGYLPRSVDEAEAKRILNFMRLCPEDQAQVIGPIVAEN